MNIWQTLGLDCTDDVTAIRRAYARKLKAIDVDAEPAAFIALRNALEAALRHAQQRAWQAGDEDDRVMELSPAGSVTPPFEASAEAEASPAASDPAAIPVEPGLPDPDDGARYAVLEQLLFDPYGATPDRDALAAAVRDILDHPGMAHLDSSAGVENWLAGILYESVPRSDPVLALVIEHFDWEKHLGRWDNPWLIEELVRRRQALAFVEAVSWPNHPHHKAWRDLSSHEEELGWTSRRRVTRVRTLLETIRSDYPAAEACLWPHRVASWDTHLYSAPDELERNGNWVWIGIVLLVAAFRIFGSGQSTTSPPAPAPFISEAPRPATTPQADMNGPIVSLTSGRFDLDDLAERNPVLHARLLARWNRHRQRPVVLAEFQADVAAMLRNAERETLRGGSYALQSAYWALMRDQLDALRGRDVEGCARAAQGDSFGADLPPELADRRNDLRTQALGERLPAHVPPPAGARRFSIPAAAVERAMRHSGLTGARLAAAWLGRGSAQDRCLAGIGLIEAALALPRAQGARLLRDMSAGL